MTTQHNEKVTELEKKNYDQYNQIVFLKDGISQRDILF